MKPSQILIRHQQKPLATKLPSFTVEYDLERSLDLGDIVVILNTLNSHYLEVNLR
jgi:hypothetical protein